MLRTRGIAKRYGKTEALSDLNLAVPQGGVYGFLGRNGAGKTTALRIVMGIVKADRGAVELFGARSGGTRTIRERQRIGYVSQEPTFYSWMTAKELGRFVGGFYPTWDAALFGRLLAAFDVAPDRRASALSGGTRAKLALALALAPRPELLILDEPTAGLDPVARREFLDIVVDGAKKGGHTVIFSSHLVDEVERVADVVGVLESGALRFEGPPAALLAEMREVDLRGQPVPAGFAVVAKLRRSGRTMLRAPAATWAAALVSGADGSADAGTSPAATDVSVLSPEQVVTTSLEEAFLALVSKATTPEVYRDSEVAQG